MDDTKDDKGMDIKNFEMEELKKILQSQNELIRGDMGYRYDDIIDRERMIMDRFYSIIMENKNIQKYMNMIGFNVPINIFDRQFHRYRIAIYKLKLSFLESQKSKTMDEKELFLINSFISNMKEMIKDNDDMLFKYDKFKPNKKKLDDEISMALKESFKRDKISVLIISDENEKEKQILDRITDLFNKNRYEEFINKNAVFSYKIVKNNEKIDKKIDINKRYDIIITNESMKMEINKLLYCMISGKTILLTY